MKLGNSITVTRMAGSSQHDFAASVVPSIYYMSADNTLKHTAVARTLRPCRAYFQFTDEIGSEARDIRLDFGDSETTEILSTTDFTDYTDKADAVYDLQGRRVKNLRKGGLYIINGRKVVFRQKETHAGGTPPVKNYSNRQNMTYFILPITIFLLSLRQN